MGLIAQRDVLAALSEQLGMPLVTVDGPPPAAPEIDGLSHRFLRQCRVFPLALDDSTLTHRHGRSAGFRNHRGRARLLRPEDPDRAGGRAGDPRRHRQALRRSERQAVERRRGRGRAGQRRSRTPARHGQRSAGHPPGERHDRATPSRSAPATSTSSRSRRNSASASAWMACCSTRRRRRAS